MISPNTIESFERDTEQYCRQLGSRLTHKRKIVLKALLLSGKSLSAYELIDYCKDELEEDVPPISMYRTLNYLTDQGLAHKLDLTNKYVLNNSLDELPKNSLFLICEHCQKVERIEISESTMQELSKNAEQAGFNISSKQIEIKCICNECAALQQ